jgi:ubiquinone/menaquinone biosynthesis C-methylase UbiE
MDNFLSANRTLWDEWAIINARSEFYEVDKFKAGARSLHPLELEELGDVQGRTMLHLQCHFGLDTLAWARRGGLVTGVDFSGQAIALARQLGQECQIPARFIESNLYDLPQVLDEQFDIVYTSYGVLTWLPNLRKWAQIVAHFLKPGGTFYIAEFHPTAMLFDDQASELQLRYPYFSSEPIVCTVQGSYADPQAEVKQSVSYEWAYPLGEVVTSLISAGLSLEFLHEYSFTVYQALPFLEQGADGYWRLPGEDVNKLPLMFSIKAKSAYR